MNETAAKFIWSFIASEVIGHKKRYPEAMDSERYAIEGDLPANIDASLSLYFTSMARKAAIEVALSTLRKFYLSSYQPEDHLVLVAYLLDNQIISAKEASELAQLHSSNFALMSNKAKDVVRLAESIAEEEQMGFIATDTDNLLKEELLDLCRSKGIDWDAMK